MNTIIAIVLLFLFHCGINGDRLVQVQTKLPHGNLSPGKTSSLDDQLSRQLQTTLQKSPYSSVMNGLFMQATLLPSTVEGRVLKGKKAVSNFLVNLSGADEVCALALEMLLYEAWRNQLPPLKQQGGFKYITVLDANAEFSSVAQHRSALEPASFLPAQPSTREELLAELEAKMRAREAQLRGVNTAVQPTGVLPSQRVAPGSTGFAETRRVIVPAPSPQPQVFAPGPGSQVVSRSSRQICEQLECTFEFNNACALRAHDGTKLELAKDTAQGYQLFFVEPVAGATADFAPVVSRTLDPIPTAPLTVELSMLYYKPTPECHWMATVIEPGTESPDLTVFGKDLSTAREWLSQTIELQVPAFAQAVALFFSKEGCEGAVLDKISCE